MRHLADKGMVTGAKDLKEALDVQKEFAQQTVQTYARQVQELSRFAARFTPKPNGRESEDGE
jgi:hypothetical protein